MKRISWKKAQSLTEVALIIAAFGLAFIAMEVYVRRGVQSRIKSLTDNMIGTEQSEYAVDVSGLSVLSSAGNTSANSTVTATTSTGGARRTGKSESVSVTATSHSEYNP